MANGRPGPEPQLLPARVSEEQLRTAVASSRSWRGVLLALGLRGSSYGPKLRNACNALDIDYSHFRSILATDARLREVIATSTDWPTALAQLGYAKGSGTARATVRKHCNRLGLETTHLAPSPMSRQLVVSQVDGLHPSIENLRHAAPYMVLAAFTLFGVAATLAPEGCRYDVIAELPGLGLKRIQVKTGTRRDPTSSSWACSLSRSEYDLAGSGGHRHAVYAAEEIDYFACIDGDLQLHLIPIDVVEGLRIINLRKYAGYRVPTLYDGRLW
jgi:hypothetical protein